MIRKKKDSIKLFEISDVYTSKDGINKKRVLSVIASGRVGLNYKEFTKKINPVYEAIKLVSNNQLVKNKDTIGFVGAPWTLLVYMINKHSPKLKLVDNFFNDEFLIEEILKILDKFIKIHIKNQINNGAEIIQIFDS